MGNCAIESLPHNAYTHGFESIYALENVDPTSIRPFRAISEEVESKGFKVRRCAQVSSKSRQLEFDLGLGFQNSLEPFHLYEPIQVLELNRFSEKILEQHHINTIQDLVSYDFHTLFLKGIGQGHIDEIKLKLKNYLVDKDSERTVWVDFGSLLRSLLGGISKKKIYVYLQQHQLHEMLQLTPADAMEVRRLPEVKRVEWVQEVHMHIMQPFRRDFIHARIKEITFNLCIPWVEKRCGFASIDEIITYLEAISTDPCQTEDILIFLSLLYFEGHFPLACFLRPSTDGVYAIDSCYADIFKDVLHKALSYFYKKSTCYNLEELICWLQREFTREWNYVETRTIKKVLQLSCKFYIWKNERGETVIKLV